MSRFNPLTASSETQSNPERPLPPPNRRRDKPQLSCTLCRKRKLKCDRGQPCETCIKRGLSPSCTYVNSNPPLNQSKQSEIKPSIYLHMQERIAELEKLVASQMDDLKLDHACNEAPSNSVEFAHSSCSSSKADLDRKMPSMNSSMSSTEISSMKNANLGVAYVESAKWTAILEGIGELKATLNDDHDLVDDNNLSSEVSNLHGPELLLGGYKKIEKQDILATIPSRPIADRLISKCFKSVEIAPIILHSPTFLNQYEQFWENPQDVSVLWLGILFGIMCLAILSQKSTPEEFNQWESLPSDMDLDGQIQIFRENASRCLAVGNYTSAGPFAIEALLLYTHIEYLIKDDVDTGLWVLLGIIVRLALRAGLHRDATQFHRISPFQSEMRRRVWAVIFMMDATASAQLGLPRMIRASQCNAKEPRNLLDEDIRQDMTSLPPARPDPVKTPVQFLVVKNKLIFASSKVSDLSTIMQQPQYAEILRIDGILNSARDSLPHWLTMRPMSKSIMDSPGLIIQRIYLTLIYQKAKCLLHRPFLHRAKRDTRYMFSRTACLEAAFEILKIQQIFDQETQSGGRLHELRGQMSSIVKNDFLLATTLVCVDVNSTLVDKTSPDPQGISERNNPGEDVVKALKRARDAWVRSGGSSREALQAVRIINGTLDKLQQIKDRNLMAATTMPQESRSINGDSVPQANSEAQLFFPGYPEVVNARLTAANPNFLPDLPEKESDTSQRLSAMGFEMGNWWESEDLTQPKPGKPDSDPRAFGWILPGGGRYDAF